MGEVEQEFSQYRRRDIADLRPYVPGEDMTTISIPLEAANEGSPLPGDMIARNPKNHQDRWLVTKQYFEDNFEAL